MSSDSRSNVQLPSGASAFLGPATPPGAKYGSSANNPYVVLRAKADTATTPSTTTYTFDHPTPDTGWAFVLGDIDADQVQVAATDEAGAEVGAAEIDSWFAGSFNYAGGTDRPTWVAATSTLMGNAGAVDTDGASGWFEPDIRLTSVTLTFTRRAGFPVYQTWFVSRARPVGGTVSDASVTGSCPVQQSTLTLVSPYGEELASVHPAADGSYDFGEFATQAGYEVRLEAPSTCAVVGAAEKPVSNRGNDGDPASRAGFTVRAIIPQPISGTVRDAGGTPVAGVAVTLVRPGGGTTTTTTAEDGRYLFDDNPAGNGYSVSIAVPAGYAAGPGGTVISGLGVVASPLVNQDFVVVALASVSGTVTGGGGGLGGVQVTLTPLGGGPAVTAVTRADGTYDLSGVAPGDYTLSILAPGGYSGPTSRPLTVAAADLTHQDFALQRPGAVSGQVVRQGDGSPVAGVAILVDGPGGPRHLSTDADGRYFVDGLPAGSYTVSVTAPAGSAVVGPGSRTVVITAAGEVRSDQDFQLAAASAAPTADLRLVKRVESGTHVVVGDSVRYRLVVSNRGPDPAPARVVVRDAMPRGLELVSAHGDGWSCRVRTGSDVVTCRLGVHLGVHRRARPIAVVARTTTAGRVVNVARVKAAGDPQRADNRSAAAVTVSPVPALPDTGFRLPATGAPKLPEASSCPPPGDPFTPRSLSAASVVGPTRVLALGRDHHGVPKPPPLTESGRWELAWDQQSHIRPGSRHGVVRLTAHTYPRDGSHGTALGNRLLRRLHVGAALTVRGRGAARLCYRVTRRLEVPADHPVPAYYSSSGRPQLAILVCSGVRRGPGDWSERTIWFAEPRVVGPASSP